MADDKPDITIETAMAGLLDWWGEMGVDVPKLAKTPKTSKHPPSRPTHSASRPAAKSTTPPQFGNLADNLTGDLAEAAAKAASKAKSLSELKSALDAFDMGALSDGARQAVFARGNPEARILIVGEAPGRDEDLAGLPFVGRSGQLLDRMMAAIGLTSGGPEGGVADDIYITNVVNFRPPGNRNPKKAEMAAHLPFLHRHIALAEPDILVLTGNIPLQALTGTTGIMKQRGVWRDVEIAGNSYPALPIYHPAFLLRRPELKADAWRDLLSLRAKYDQLPPRPHLEP